MPDPNEPLTVAEQQVFGHDAKRHPVLGFVLEKCDRAEGIEQQTKNYLALIYRLHGAAAMQQCVMALNEATQNKPPSVKD